MAIRISIPAAIVGQPKAIIETLLVAQKTLKEEYIKKQADVDSDKITGIEYENWLLNYYVPRNALSNTEIMKAKAVLQESKAVSVDLNTLFTE